MSWQSAEEPEVVAPPACKALQHVIVPRPRDIGGFEVRRVLPAPERRNVGPFVFFDQMGPAELAPGAGIDVRPHPHIGLATVTYLFAGTIIHRDSLGTVQAIEPGEVNWMTAGRGIAHSERSDAELRKQREKLYGIQIWVALPKQHEETAPDFTHYEAGALPVIEGEGKTVRADRRFAVWQAVAGQNIFVAILCRRVLDARGRGVAGKSARGAGDLFARRKRRDRRSALRAGPVAGVRSRRCDFRQSKFRGQAALVRRRTARRAAPPVVELCLQLARADRASQRPIGKRDASHRCRAIPSSFRCPKDREAAMATLDAPIMVQFGKDLSLRSR